MKFLILTVSFGLAAVVSTAQAQNMNMRPTHPTAGSSRSGSIQSTAPTAGFNMRPTHHTTSSGSTPATSTSTATSVSASGADTNLHGEAAYKSQQHQPAAEAPPKPQTSETEPSSSGYGTEQDFKGGQATPAAPKDESTTNPYRGGAR